MKSRMWIAGALALLVAALVTSACSPPLRLWWQGLSLAPSEPLSAAPPTATAALSPTAPPMVGPMGTLTAVAELLASPTPDRTPYEIVNQGRPHFLFFHAWW